MNSSVNASFLEENWNLILSSLSVNLILGLPLNVCVVWLISAGFVGTLASNFFSFNMAVSDVVFSLFSLCYFFFIYLHELVYMKVFAFILGLSMTGRPLFQCLICVECYMGVLHPVLFLHYKDMKYRASCAAAAWIGSIASCVYNEFTFTKPLYLYAYFIQHLLMLLLMISCCVSVLWALQSPGPGDALKKKENSSMKRKAFKTMLLLTVSRGISSVFCMAAIPMQHIRGQMESSNVFTICMDVALLSGVLQPILYLHRAGKLFCFRK